MPADPLEPFPPEAVVWEGRPALGLLPADLLAGLTAAAGTWPGLALGLWWLFELEAARSAALGGLYASLLGLGVTVARAAGGGPALVPVAAFALPVVVAAALASEHKSGVACAATLAGAVAVALVWRYRQRRGLRYQVTREQVALGEQGRYTIVFARAAAPALREDRFGDLGELTFPPFEARLTTRDGKTFRLPPQPHRLVRLREAARLAEVLGAAPAPRGG